MDTATALLHDLDSGNIVSSTPRSPTSMSELLVTPTSPIRSRDTARTELFPPVQPGSPESDYQLTVDPSFRLSLDSSSTSTSPRSLSQSPSTSSSPDVSRGPTLQDVLREMQSLRKAHDRDRAELEKLRRQQEELETRLEVRPPPSRREKADPVISVSIMNFKY